LVRHDANESLISNQAVTAFFIGLRFGNLTRPRYCKDAEYRLVAGKRGMRFLPLFASAVVAALIVVAALLATPNPGAGSKTSGGSFTSSSSASGAGSTAAAQVNSSFAAHVDLLMARNVSSIVGQYESNDTVTWDGTASGFAGLYIGTNNTSELLSLFLGRSSSFVIGNLTAATTITSNTRAIVNSNFTFSGESSALGNFTGAVSAQDTFVYSPSLNTWLISQEIWNFRSFEVQFPPTGGYGIAPTGNETAGSLALSANGNYLAVGTQEIGGSNGSLSLVSLDTQPPSILWKHLTNGTSIGSIAISSDGSFILASGHDNSTGQLFMFNAEGRELWSFPTPGASILGVALSSNGSRIAATYGNSAGPNGIVFLDGEGNLLWNYTVPARTGPIDNFAMSSDGSSIVFTHDGLFDLNSRGQQVWNYTKPPSGAFVQISDNGAFVATGTTPGAYNGSVLYFNGADGKLLWARQVFTEVQPLVMSADGSRIAIAGNTGVMLLDSDGNLLWNDSYSEVTGVPASILQSSSLVLVSGYGFGATGFDRVQLVGYNGTVVATFSIDGLSTVAASPNGQTWVASGGVIREKGGACATLHVFEGSSAVATLSLC
jgi:hypothetical protein